MDLVGGQPDRVLDTLGFQIFVDPRHGEGRVRPEIDARDLAPVPRNDGLEHTLPAIGAVNVARAKGAALQIAELVEHE